MYNEIYLRRKGKILVNGILAHNPISSELVATFIKNIESLGYTFSKEVIDLISRLDKESLNNLYLEIIPILKSLKGANVNYNPMYPNFPEQVMEASEVELYLNAIIHYISNGTYLPEYEKKERLPLIENTDLKVIELGDISPFNDMMLNLMIANSSLSEQDKNDLKFFIEKNINNLVLPNEIPNKENMAFIVATIMRIDTKNYKNLGKRFIKTATDVLRLATALSDGDVSLAENTRFKSFRRFERNILLKLLDSIISKDVYGLKYVTQDMKRHLNKWVRLGERLHPHESKYAKKYKNAREAFVTIRNESYKIKLSDKKVTPGEFVRSLNSLIESGVDGEEITSQLIENASKVSTPVLVQALNFFLRRNTESLYRTFLPKGNIGKLYIKENDLKGVPTNLSIHICVILENALKERFKKLPELGTCYIDPELKNYTIPFSQRSASKSSRIIPRFSKIKLPEGNTLRFFLWWKENNDTGRVDIDLSSILYDSGWNYKEHISYTNLKSSKYNACHSGDITTAPEGACEFIDIDIQSVIDYGGRYVIPSALSYSSQPFSTLPEARLGWMMRQEPQSGEIFDPKTVVDKIEITSNTRNVIPAIFDLVNREVIWVDLSLKSSVFRPNNVEANYYNMTVIGQAITELQRPDLYTLFKLHAESRGTIVDSKEEADVIFSVDEGIKPEDIDIILGKYLQ